MVERGCEVWVARLSEFRGQEAALDAVLTPDERAYCRLRRGARATATVSRGLLRLLVARHLSLAPSEVEIDRSCPECGQPHGRPRLVAGPATRGGELAFSVTHGGDLLVIALARHTPVGVDVEPVGAGDVDDDLLDFALTPSERSHVRGTPAGQRRAHFLRYWTGKEAVLKALGTGLRVEPQAVTLPSPPTGGRATAAVPGRQSARLWVSPIDVGPAHVCSLATGDPIPDLQRGWLSSSFVRYGSTG